MRYLRLFVCLIVSLRVCMCAFVCVRVRVCVCVCACVCGLLCAEAWCCVLFAALLENNVLTSRQINTPGQS